ncbi:Arc family DNA-binding protein [bacterium]|nr:Arc family DNA-binding protein [bacterium]
MAEILVRNLDKKTVDRLKKRAKKKGRSLQTEVKQILEQAASIDMDAARKLTSNIRSGLKRKKFSDSTELIREDRDK